MGLYNIICHDINLELWIFGFKMLNIELIICQLAIIY